MERIMVFDVPAVSGGALSILKMYYERAVGDIQNEYIFVVSIPELEDRENIKVLNFPNVKKSWLHRLWFEMFTAGKIVKKYKPDRILALHDIIIKGVRQKQELYMHQSLSFIDYRFNFFVHPELWIRRNIIGILIKRSVKKADKVIVQTNWIKNALIKQCKVIEDKIKVEWPEVNAQNIKKYEQRERPDFFYPAAPFFYKNHMLIIKALLLLKKQNYNPKVILSLKDDGNKLCRKIKKISKKSGLDVVFAGTLTQQQVFEYYSKTILLFPSFIETFGLPLLEAKLSQTPIICADTPFAKEICIDYDKVHFFDHDNPSQLAELMKNFCGQKELA